MKRLLLVLILLLVPFANALDATVDFEKRGQPIGFVSTKVIPNVDLVITVSGENFSWLSADLSGINKNSFYVQTHGYQNMVTTADLCFYSEANQNTICYFRGLQLQIPSDTVSIPIILSDDETEEIVTATYTFSIDDSKPAAIFLGTSACLDEFCYIANDKLSDLVLSFEDTRATFDYKMVAFNLAGRETFAYECVGLTCIGRDAVSCEDSQRVMLRMVKTKTYDDAYNPVDNAFSTSLVCDALNPIILENQTTVESDSPYGEIKQGDRLKITVYVEELNEGVTGTINTSTINGGDLQYVECHRNNEGVFECVFSVPGIQPGVASPEIIIKDIVGNEARTNPSIMVMPRLEGITPDCFDVIRTELTPESIDRILLDLTLKNEVRYPVFAEYTIQLNSCLNAIALNQEIIDCQFVNEAETELNPGSNIFDVWAVADKSSQSGDNRINFEFDTGADVNDFGNQFEVRCNLSIVVSDNSGVYELEEMELLLFPFKFRNSRLGEPGERFIEKIEEYENNDLVKASWIGDVNKALGTASDICSIGVYLDYFEAAAVTTELVGLAVEAITHSDVVTTTGTKMYGTSKKLEDQMKGNPVGKDQNMILGLVGKMCDWSSCTVGETSWSMGDEWFNSGLGGPAETLRTSLESSTLFGDYANADEMLEDVSTPNVENSLVAAIMTGCWEAVPYHINNYRESECEVLSCLKMNSVYGLDVYGCEETRAAFVCNQIIGEAFEITPGVNQVTHFTDNLNHYVNNLLPNVLLTASRYACRETGDLTGADISGGGVFGKKTKIALCHLPDSIGRFMLQDSLTSGSRTFVYTPSDDLCSKAQCSASEIMDGSCEIGRGSILPGYADVPRPDADDIRQFQKTVRDQQLQKYTPQEVRSALLKTRAQQVTHDDKKFGLNDKDKKILAAVFGDGQNDANSVSSTQLNDYLNNPGQLNTRVNNINAERDPPTYHAAEDQEALRLLGDRDAIMIIAINNHNTGTTAGYANAAADIELLEDLRGRSNLDSAQQADLDRLTASEAQNRAIIDSAGVESVDQINAQLLTHPSIDQSNIDNSDGIKIMLTNRENNRKAAVWNEKLSKNIDFAGKFLYNFVIKKWLTFEALFPDHTFLGSLEDYNTDALKNEICNPDNSLFFDNLDAGTNVGVVHECGEGSCALVLTWGAERVYYNETHYLYSMVYLIGGVDEEVKFNVYLETANGEKSNTRYPSMHTLAPGSQDNFATASLSNKLFTKMCIEFNDVFPPNRWNAPKKYCRDIKEDTYRTGVPVPIVDGEYQIQSQDWNI